MRLVSRITLFSALVCLVPYAAQADPIDINVGDSVTIQQISPDITTGAGPFALTVNGDALTSFVSLCLQANVGTWEDMANTFYVAGITDFATWQSDAVGGDENGHDQLSSQTAWLYTQFRQGTLTGYDGSGVADDALQWAVWQLEDERGTAPEGETYSALANSFVQLAEDAVANGFTGIGDVRVLNLVNADGSDAQDQLVFVPEASSLEMLALGALLLFVGRRRFGMPQVGGFA